MAGKKKGQKRGPTEQFRLDLDVNLFFEVEGLFSRQGLSRTEAVHRLFRWLIAQPQSVQAAVLDQLPEDMLPHAADQVASQWRRHNAGTSGRIAAHDIEEPIADDIDEPRE